jgi:acetyltransferase
MPHRWIDRLLTPRSVNVVGAATPDGKRVAANLAAAGFQSAPGPADLTIIASAGEQALADLASCRGGAALLTGQAPNLREAARAAGVRVLGPSSFGLAVPALGLNASLSHMPVPAGHIGLVTQSASLARAVVDWAGPNGVGFSYVVGIGGHADVGFSEVLDFLARDAQTRLILLDIRRVRDRRAFISAARAASRMRPVVALRPGGLLMDGSGQSDAVFAAALNRAGVFVVQRMEAFLAAAETLSRARPLRGEAMAVITNAIGPGRLAADAALRAGIRLAILPPAEQATLTASLPAELTLGLVYAGSAAPTDVASIASMVSAVPEVGGVLVLLAPTGPGDAAAVEAVIAAGHTAHLPVLTCVMGETTGAVHRQRIAEAGLPAFATPEQAVQGFSHLLRDRAARFSARELPPSRVLEVAPEHDRAAAIVAGARAEGRLGLAENEATDLLGCYGLRNGEETPACARLSVADDESFGPALALSATPETSPAYDLPPLNLKLAADLARRAGVAEASRPAAIDALARVSQLLVDLPEVATLEIGQLLLPPHGPPGVRDVRVGLRPPGQRALLAISPYPEDLVELWESHGQAFTIRPIRPEDAEAHTAMVRRIPAEDLRYRFFSAVREVAPEQMMRLTQIDYDREMAFIAVRAADGATVGVSRLVCEAAGESGEFAILVEPDCKGLGLARHLMDRLIGWARARGLPAITGQILADNQPMLGFVRHLGFSLRHAPDEPDMVEAVLDLS